MFLHLFSVVLHPYIYIEHLSVPPSPLTAPVPPDATASKVERVTVCWKRQSKQITASINTKGKL